MSRDRVVSEGMGGVAADWGPFHSARKREDMRQWLLSQDYCVPGPETLRRPGDAARLGIVALRRGARGCHGW